MECDNLPLGSIIAMLVCWLGIGFYCHKMRQGLDAIIGITKELFANLVPFFMKLKLGLLCVGIAMAVITGCMAIVGMLATKHCHGTFRDTGFLMEDGHRSSFLTRWKARLGGKWACTLFLVLNYLLYICWLAVFAFTVAIITVYHCFDPICVRQAGFQTEMCFNFTSFAMLLANGNPQLAVSMTLCGKPISQLCKLTKVFSPWYLTAFIGCILILLGLNHFTACLAANFAHNRRAGQYVKRVTTAVSRSVSPDSEPTKLASGSCSPGQLNLSPRQPENSLRPKDTHIYLNGIGTSSKVTPLTSTLSATNDKTKNSGHIPAAVDNIYDTLNGKVLPRKDIPPVLPEKRRKLDATAV